ncbi:MAG TPA: sulfate ABC transporter permease subunit CysW [Nitrospirota bacterium]|jgi:sulfate transport system permease protein
MEKLVRTRKGKVSDPAWVRAGLITFAFLFLCLFLFVPLAAVFSQAFDKGAELYLAAIKDPDARAAIRLTLITAAVCVPVNVIFGICAAWTISKFDFPGKSILITLIDLPFAVSPVIAGMIFVLLLGARSTAGGWFADHGLKIIFSTPGIIIATLFVTFPYVARELIPMMQAYGKDEEEAAATLGAGGIKTFILVTLPNIKWGLLYGIILCNARVMGEFGAVSVVSGHIRGETNTVPLHVEILYNEYNFQAAFAVASLLAMLAIVTLIFKKVLEKKTETEGIPPR